MPTTFKKILWSVDGYLDCFHLLAIVYNATMHLGVQVSAWVPAFSSLGPRSRSSPIDFFCLRLTVTHRERDWGWFPSWEPSVGICVLPAPVTILQTEYWPVLLLSVRLSFQVNSRPLSPSLKLYFCRRESIQHILVEKDREAGHLSPSSHRDRSEGWGVDLLLWGGLV